MRATPSFGQRLTGAAVSAALAVASFAASGMPAGAQTCPYNSTQGTCACPTSGAGTTCFGGQLYRASDNSCQNDARPCASNQNWSCASESCVCDTASFPCGGCTAASSTVGASCAAPAGGQYANACGACACPAGTTLCSSGNNCVTNRSCPAGTTWDPCTDTCGTPNVLLSPAFVQSGYMQINGDMRSTAGNLRLDAATGPNQGDVYIANGKALRVDGAGITGLSIGNWGVGGTSINLSVLGNLFPYGISTFPGDTTIPANTVEATQLCLGNGVNCRTTWPSSTDFNPTYVNASGADAMSGPLTINGAGTNLLVAGAAGAAGSPKVQITAPATNEGLRIVSAADASPLNIRNSANTVDLFRVDQTGTLQVGSVPWARLSAFPAACPAGQFVTAVGGTPTCAAPTGLTGSGTTNIVPKFTGASSLGNSSITDTGSHVHVNTSFSSGVGSDATGTDAVSGGYYTHARGANSVAMGFLAEADGAGAVSLGYQTHAPGFAGVAIGENVNAGGASSSPYAVSIGSFSTAGGNTSHTFGQFLTSNASHSFSIGTGALSTSTQLVNNVAGAIMMGVNSTVPTMTLTQAAGGTTTGKVGIATTAPADKLTVVGNDITSQNVVSASSPSVSAGGNLFYGAINNTNVSNTDFIEFQSGSTLTEKLRVSGSGQWIMRPDNTNTNGGLWIMLGNINNPFNVAAGLDVRLTDTTSGTGGWTGLDLSVSGTGTGTGQKNLMKLSGPTGGVSSTFTVDRYANTGIGATAPAVKLAVGGNGANVYNTSAWIENNMHVQGNETLAQGSGRGRLRVGTAWGYPGMYAEQSSNGWNTDLVLGASSDHVLINAGSFGRPGAASTLELWGSRLIDAGGGTLSIRSGGSEVAFDGGDTVRVDNSLQLGGVPRSSWPSLQQTTQYCQYNAGSGANWKTCSCPAGYVMTGWTGYNCESNGGEWECSATAPSGSTGVQVWHDSAGTAYVWTICARVN